MHAASRMRAAAKMAGALFLLWPVGCGDFDDRPGRSGELGTGTFRYICVGENDPYCEEGDVARTFPDHFAVEGRFDLEFVPDEDLRDDERSLRVTPGTKNVAIETMSYFITAPGWTVFFAENAQGEVYDLRHFYAAPIGRLAVLTGEVEPERLALSPGEDLTLEVRPKDELGTLLAGSLDYTWSVEDESVARLTTMGHSRTVVLTGEAEGTTELVVATRTFEARLEVVVGDGSSETSEPGSSSGESSTGDGSTEPDPASTSGAPEATGSTGGGEG